MTAIGGVTFVADLLLVAIATARLCRPDRRFTDGPVLFAGILVATAQLLSLAGWLASPAAWLAMHGGLLCVFLGHRVLQRVAPAFKPGSLSDQRPLTPSLSSATSTEGRNIRIEEIKHRRAAVLAWGLWSRRDPGLKAGATLDRADLDAHALRALTLILAVTYAVLFYLCLAVPPNNWDAQTYHLSRVGYYLQQGTLAHFPTANTRQVEFPFNAELLILWTAVFLRTDRLANLVQFAAALALFRQGADLSRELGVSDRAARLTALVGLSLPMVIFQATSAQNDLVVTWFTLAAAGGLWRFWRTGAWADAVLAGLAGGLALGTKNTVLLCLPGVALAMLVWSRVGWHALRLQRACSINDVPRATPFPKPQGVPPEINRWSLAGRLVLGGVPAAALCGALWAVENWRATGHVLSQHEGATQRVAHPGLASFTANLGRLGYQWIDWSGLPDRSRVAAPLMALQRDLGARWAAAAPVNASDWTIPGTQTFPTAVAHLHEDLAWFGPNGWLLWGVCGVVGLATAARRRDWDLLAWALLPASFVLCYAFFLKWQPWAGRLFCLPIGLAIPLVAAGVERLLTVRGSRLYFAAVLLIAAATCLTCATENVSKPLKKVRRRSELALRYPGRPEMQAVAAWLQTHRRPRATLGFCGHEDDGDHVAFQPDFALQVKRFGPTPAAVAQALADAELDLLIAHPADGLRPSAPGWTTASPAPGWFTLTRD